MVRIDERFDQRDGDQLVVPVAGDGNAEGDFAFRPPAQVIACRPHRSTLIADHGDDHVDIGSERVEAHPWLRYTGGVERLVPGCIDVLLQLRGVRQQRVDLQHRVGKMERADNGLCCGPQGGVERVRGKGVGDGGRPPGRMRAGALRRWFHRPTASRPYSPDRTGLGCVSRSLRPPHKACRHRPRTGSSASAPRQRDDRYILRYPRPRDPESR